MSISILPWHGRVHQAHAELLEAGDSQSSGNQLTLVWQVIIVIHLWLPVEVMEPQPGIDGMEAMTCATQDCVLLPEFGCALTPDLIWLQEARERPTFAEIIQVLRKLFGEEARRNPANGPGEAISERVLQASTSGGSGEMSQKAQVATSLLHNH